ncbi:putative integral membrane protein (TIGR00698 family) [Agrobacterium vitis]|nr:putative integral membrane protein (TIGR00698 family) [Agrobacterium vitis]MBE1440412.1 putative integral membrane protein (TIGR00698 family) [Agrobacterium vitis]
MQIFHRFTAFLPGISLSFAVSLGGYGIAYILQRATGQTLVDALVWCILLGVLINSTFTLLPKVQDGIHFCAKTVLEVAIVLLGASISLSQIAGNGPALIVAVMVVVCCAISCSYLIGRALRLSHSLALLVACGNSICGNSAIMAAAPVIGAESDDVASAIAFTAVLGIVVVLALPLVAFQTGLNSQQYGILAGMTVYAVPQVLAATASSGIVSLQMGTVVKLIRVMMLGPVLLLLGMNTGRSGRVHLSHIAPWFIMGFLLLLLARSLDILPHGILAPSQQVSGFFTTLSMAALGLQVNLRSVLASGGRVLAAGSLSIVALAAIAGVAIHVIG